MKALGTIFAVILGIWLYQRYVKNRVTSGVSANNPNYPVSQPIASGTGDYLIGPQGPNDGSNSYDAGGHTIYPPSVIRPIDQPIVSRGFRYTGGAQPGGVRVQVPVY